MLFIVIFIMSMRSQQDFVLYHHVLMLLLILKLSTTQSEKSQIKFKSQQGYCFHV